MNNESGHGAPQRPGEGQRDTGRDTIVTKIALPAGHEVFAGHFEDFPIVAGVHQIDWVAAVLSHHHGVAVQVTAIPRAKFTAMIRPGANLELTVTVAPGAPGTALGAAAQQGLEQRHNAKWGHSAKWRLTGRDAATGKERKFSEGRVEYSL